MNLFLPKQPAFYDLFEQISQTLTDMANLFSVFIRDFKNFPEYSKKAHEIENRGDRLTHEVINRLNKTFITPFDREDIYMLAQEMDDIIDLIENVVHNIDLYKITEKHSALEKFAALIQDAAAQMATLLKCLRDLKYTAEFSQAKINIHNLEDRGDEIFTTSISELLNNGGDAVYIIKQKDILEGLEHVLDKFQQVSDIIEGIVVKSS